MAQRRIMKVEPVQKKWLSMREAMAYLGCSERFLRELKNNAEVKFTKRGRMIWYELQSLDRFFERNRVI